MLTVHEMEDGDRAMYYIFEDVADIFWPGDFDHGNHGAEERVIARLKERGLKESRSDRFSPGYQTPHGDVFFDSESGAFECHSYGSTKPVEYIREVILEIQSEILAARKVIDHG